jgi:hypothetical protein
MAPAVVALLAIIVLFAGTVVGWHARRAYGAHGDMKVSKSRVPTFRATRNKGGLVAIGVLVLALLLIRVLL